MSAIIARKGDAGAVLDAVPGGVLQAYFDVKEHFFCYRQFNNPSRRRDFATAFIASVEAMLGSAISTLPMLFEHYVRPRRETRNRQISLASEWSRFAEFFDETSLSDLPKAKAAYRKAALMLHPDVGGNADDMVALNDAFAAILDAIMFREIDGALEPAEGFARAQRGDGASSFALGPVTHGFWPGSILQYPRSVKEFDLLLRTEALLAAIDIFAEDQFAEIATPLELIEDWQIGADSAGTAFDKASACESVARILLTVVEAANERGDPTIGPRLQSLARTWIGAAVEGWVAHGRLNGDRSKKRAEAAEEAARREGRYPFVEEWRERDLRQLAQKIEFPGSRGSQRFQLNHQLQVENAFRRNLITAARYKTASERLGGRRDSLAAVAAEVAQFAAGHGFMRLEHDPSEVDNPVSVRFVPEGAIGAAFGRWVLDSKQACRSYGDAFYRSDDLAAKLKFVRQRLWITLSSLVADSDRWDVSRLLAATTEISHLEKAARAAREGQAGEHAADLHGFLTALAAEPNASRTERLRVLARFAREDFRDSLPKGVEPQTDTPRSKGRNSDGSPLTRVIPSPEYYRAALRPLEELRQFSGGKAWADPAHDDRQEGLRYYSEHMQKLSNRMFGAIQTEPAEKLIEKLAPLIRRAIDQGAPLNAAAEWQLGFYIDKLTGAMVRTRQFAAAADALQEFFALPEAYRGRTAVSEEKVLRSRLARCQRNRAVTHTHAPDRTHR